jgi:methionyl-tRNA formyltransferase
MGSELVLRTVKGIVEGSLTATPQNDSEATVAPILKKSDAYIDWTKPAASIHNRIRAFQPWPGSVTRFRGVVCKILRSRFESVALSTHAGSSPGTIVASRQSLAVVCGDGTLLELLELQPENRKPVSGIAFANGAHITSGEKFETMGDN